MKLKDVLLVVGGVALGYIASKIPFLKKKQSGIEQIESEIKGVATTIKPNELIKEKEKETKQPPSECERKLLEKLAVMRFRTSQAKDSFSSNFLVNCKKAK